MNIKISKKEVIIISVITLFFGISFILRALPALQMNFPSYHLHGDPDTWYNFRQIESMVSNFPHYSWFDPMTAYPSGKQIAWGPVFPIIVSALSIMVGGTQRFDIMLVASWVPVLLALLMIPVMFYLGKIVRDWKTGLISAIFIAVVSGNYFYESYFGVVDHHIAEVVFTTIFSLFYILSIQRSNGTEISLSNPLSFKILLVPSIFAGIAFGIALLTAPTCILFLAIIVIYTILQYSWNIFHKKSTDYLFVINCIIASIALLFLILNGVPSVVYSLMEYSIAQIHILLLFITIIFFIQVLSLFFKTNSFFFILSIVCTFFGVSTILYFGNHPLESTIIVTLVQIFGNSNEWATIQEWKPWSFGEIWVSFNIGIILAIVGFLLMIYHFVKNEKPESLYISVWGVWILVMTFLQVRWEYYCAVVISILSAYVLGYLLTFDSSSSDNKERNKKNSKKGSNKEETLKTSILKTEFLKRRKGTVIVLVCLVIFCGVSVIYDYAIVRNTQEKLLIPQQWVGTLEWVQTGTPDPNISYFGPYDSETWQYPRESYGILSWWDTGHWITFIGKRIPVTNPFQDNIIDSAKFFLTESEERAGRIVDSHGVRYIITDSQMVFGKFPGMVKWYNSSYQTGYYSDTYYLNDREVPENSGLIGLFNQPYYSTMIVRLHNFDGSLKVPDQVALAVISGSQTMDNVPVVNSIEFLASSAAREKLNTYEPNRDGGTSAIIGGFLMDSPLEKIGALHHYRLVHEDAARKTNGDYDFSSMVKVFEYVPGARLAGQGMIEVKIKTNLGRTFMYRQEAEDGWFILPYATKGETYPVTTIGPYILSSGQTIEITEEEVRTGKIIK